MTEPRPPGAMACLVQPWELATLQNMMFPGEEAQLLFHIKFCICSLQSRWKEGINT